MSIASRVAQRYLLSIEDAVPVTQEDINKAIQTFEFEMGEVDADHESIWAHISGSFDFRGMKVIFYTTTESGNFKLTPKDIDVPASLDSVENTEDYKKYFDGKYFFPLTKAIVEKHRDKVENEIINSFTNYKDTQEGDYPGWKPSSNYRPR
jgi:hypothetical protein